MRTAITGSAAVTCLGDRHVTAEAVLGGACGVRPLAFHDAQAVNVTHAYQIPDPVETPLRPTAWLTRCLRDAVHGAGLDVRRRRVTAVIGTGLGESRAVEGAHAGAWTVADDDLYFAAAVRRTLPGLNDVLTVVNACAASGYALAIGADLLEAGEADAVVVAGTDSLTLSMLAMIGRLYEVPADRVRPFDRDRPGVLLGEGAAAVVLEPDHPGLPREGVLHGVGLSCDAHHATAPARVGIAAAVRDAHRRAGLTADQVDLVVAHGTGTVLNDPTEAAILTEVFADAEPGPLVTALKGAIGHTSGASALMSLIVAMDCLRRGLAPPVTGLRTPAPEAHRLRLVRRATPCSGTVIQVDAFGFGGVNAVLLAEVDR